VSYYSVLLCLAAVLLVPVFQSFSAFVVFFFSLLNFYLKNFGVALVSGFLVVVFLLFCMGLSVVFLCSLRASPVRIRAFPHASKGREERERAPEGRHPKKRKRRPARGKPLKEAAKPPTWGEGGRSAAPSKRGKE
jgi:hypothetical protein